MDPRHGGVESLRALTAEYGELPATAMVSTGGGGSHYLFACPERPLGNSAGKLGAGLDVRGKGGYIVAPPSLHASGKRYEWIRGLDEGELAQMPLWMIDKLVGHGSPAGVPLMATTTADQLPVAALKRAAMDIVLAEVGTRNITLNSAAYSMGPWVVRDCLSRERVEEALSKAAAICGLDHTESIRTIASGLVAGIRDAEAEAQAITPEVLPPEGKSLPPADVADAVLAGFFEGASSKLWHYRCGWWLWDGRSYSEYRELKSSTFQYLQNGGVILRKYARGSFVSDVLLNLAARCTLPARVEPPIWIRPEGQHEPAANTIALANGILDVNAYLTGGTDVLTVHTPEYFTMACLPFPFDRTATCPRWQRFLVEVLPDEECRTLIQEFYGYCLTFDVSQHTAMLWPGEGNNGKSTALNVLGWLLGERNVSSVPLARFGERFSLADTVSKLANIANEIGEFDRADEAVLKNFISGEPMSFERKGQQLFTALPTARLLFATNVLPRFSDRTGGLWRRIIIVPFTVVIPEERIDRTLGGVLRGELAGIFLWALEGLRRLKERGHFSEPAISVTEKAELRRTANPAREFLDDMCTEEAEATVSKTTLYRAYVNFCRDKGTPPLSDANFGREVKRHFPNSGETQRRVEGQRLRSYKGFRFHDGGWHYLRA